jgi:hypothetical protein
MGCGVHRGPHTHKPPPHTPRPVSRLDHPSPPRPTRARCSDCKANCSEPVLERRLVLPAVDYTGKHAEERALTLNSGTGGAIPYTYNQGRLSLSENRAVVSLAGYAAPAGWNLFTAPQKVEPITFSLYASGYYNISTGCKVWSTGYRAIYCEQGAWGCGWARQECVCARGGAAVPLWGGPLSSS